MEGFYLLLLIPGSIFLTMGLIFLFLMRKVTKPAKDWKLTTGIIIQKEKNYTISIGNFFNKGDFVSTQPDSAPTFQYEVNGIQYEKTSKIEQSPGFSIGDRKSTRLNSSHVAISYAVFCLKKKIKANERTVSNMIRH